jgi:hypothetical protein
MAYTNGALSGHPWGAPRGEAPWQDLLRDGGVAAALRVEKQEKASPLGKTFEVGGGAKAIAGQAVGVVRGASVRGRERRMT